ncbi:hypothetical protein M3Y97_00900300 [Aphelenchoides bicaudatus]|nr:hypothetical protein M3Y97_00900300 [Aphelenchoides bicaudatus]
MFKALQALHFVWQSTEAMLIRFFPYISNNGDGRPESCIFSSFLNICAMFSALIVHLRYDLIAELNRNSNDMLTIINKLSWYFGMIGAFGMFLVANFQESAVIQVHLTGAFLSFGFGCVYMLCHAGLSHLMVPLFASRRVAHIRTVLSVVGIFAFFTCEFSKTTLFTAKTCFSAFTCGILASNEFHKYHPDLPTPRPWTRKNPHEGFKLHCVSAGAEWTLAVINVLFFLSYSRDFEKIQVKLTVNPLVGHLDMSPQWSSESNLVD